MLRLTAVVLSAAAAVTQRKSALDGANPAEPDTGIAVLKVSDPTNPDLVDTLRQ